MNSFKLSNNEKTYLPVNDAYGFVYFTDYIETEGYRSTVAPSLYFDGIPKKIDLDIGGIVFYETGGPDFYLGSEK